MGTERFQQPNVVERACEPGDGAVRWFSVSMKHILDHLQVSRPPELRARVEVRRGRLDVERRSIVSLALAGEGEPEKQDRASYSAGHTRIDALVRK